MPIRFMLNYSTRHEMVVKLPNSPAWKEEEAKSVIRPIKISLKVA